MKLTSIKSFITIRSKKIIRYCNDPYFALGGDMIKRCPKLMSDNFYIRTLWRQVMGYKLDLNNPITFSEKLQWLKLHDHNPLYSTLVDKIRVKQWVAQRIGQEYIIPTLAVYKDANEINLDKLPNKFVLKCNHDSGSIVICRDKSNFDLKSSKIKLEKCLNHNFYWDAREWPYKKIKPLIFAEKYMENTGHKDLIDYKFFCFNGIPKFMYISCDHSLNPTTDFYDMQWNKLPIRMRDPNSDAIHNKPQQFELMQQLAVDLSANIPHVRVDFYLCDDKILFGELTFYHNAGFSPIYPNEWDIKIGNLITL